jgi:hypothetical protein
MDDDDFDFGFHHTSPLPRATATGGYFASLLPAVSSSVSAPAVTVSVGSAAATTASPTVAGDLDFDADLAMLDQY